MESLEKLVSEAKDAIDQAGDLKQLDLLRIQYLGKKGSLTEQMQLIGTLPPEERKSFGRDVNQAKESVSELLIEKKQALEAHELQEKLARESVDISLPPRPTHQGKLHPIAHVIDEVVDFFTHLGFTLAKGPDIEDDYHNFSALNFPESHPAKDEHDTFFLQGKDALGLHHLLRTHTSPVQIRGMKNNQPPFKYIVPGRTYRCDSDPTHTPMFHQLEGVYIDKGIHMGHMKGCLTQFIHTFFGREDIPVRFRSSFFPFTEPSAELDIGCKRTKDSLIIGPGKDWLEFVGCGMVHPNVLRNVGLDPSIYQGFAFGMGIERIACLKYGVPDIRAYYDSDIRFLNHFGFNAA